EHGRGVDRLDRTNPQASLLDASDGHLMDAERIRAVRRTCCKHARERIARIAAWVNLEYVSVRGVEPGDDEDLVASLESGERFRREGVDLEPRIGRALGALLRRRLQRAQLGADHPDGSNCVFLHQCNSFEQSTAAILKQSRFAMALQLRDATA